MEKTWKPKTAGILSIIGGSFGIGAGAWVTLMGGWGMNGWGMHGPGMYGMYGPGMFGWVAALGGGLLALGIIALIGGIITLRRKAWGFALASAICALFPVVPLGILAIIFVSMGRKEFA
jgi:hypothetical protein